MMGASPHSSNVNIPRSTLQTSTHCGSSGVVHMVNQTGQYLLAAPLGEIYFGLLDKFFLCIGGFAGWNHIYGI